MKPLLMMCILGTVLVTDYFLNHLNLNWFYRIFILAHCYRLFFLTTPVSLLSDNRNGLVIAD